MDGGEDNRDGTGACRMCLAIPGKIVGISSENENSALVEVAGVRRTVDWWSERLRHVAARGGS